MGTDWNRDARLLSHFSCLLGQGRDNDLKHRQLLGAYFSYESWQDKKLAVIGVIIVQFKDVEIRSGCYKFQ